MATQTIYVGKDAPVYEINPGNNYGGSVYMGIKEGANDGYGYVEFDITSAPVAGVVTSVMIYQWCYSNPGTPAGTFRRCTSQFVENTIKWNLQPSITDTNATGFTFPAFETWASQNITQLYKDAKNAGSYLGLQMRRTASGNGKDIATKEHSGGTYKMYIVITYSVTDYYVKTTGNDALTGDSWTNAWETINKAATTVIDGSTVHIGFGDYLSEPSPNNKIAPQNAGTTGIKYLCETAGSSGGVGTVKIEKN